MGNWISNNKVNNKLPAILSAGYDVSSKPFVVYASMVNGDIHEYELDGDSIFSMIPKGDKWIPSTITLDDYRIINRLLLRQPFENRLNADDYCRHVICDTEMPSNEPSIKCCEGYTTFADETKNKSCLIIGTVDSATRIYSSMSSGVFVVSVDKILSNNTTVRFANDKFVFSSTEPHLEATPGDAYDYQFVINYYLKHKRF